MPPHRPSTHRGPARRPNEAKTRLNRTPIRTLPSFARALRDDITTTTTTASSECSFPASHITTTTASRGLSRRNHKLKFPLTEFDGFGHAYVYGVKSGESLVGDERVSTTRFREHFSQTAAGAEERDRGGDVDVDVVWDDIGNLGTDEAWEGTPAPELALGVGGIGDADLDNTSAAAPAPAAPTAERAQPNLARKLSKAARRVFRSTLCKVEKCEDETSSLKTAISSPFNFHDYSAALEDQNGSVIHPAIQAIPLSEAQALPPPEREKDGLVKRAASQRQKERSENGDVYVETYRRYLASLESQGKAPPLLPSPPRKTKLSFRRVIGASEKSTDFGEIIAAANDIHGHGEIEARRVATDRVKAQPSKSSRFDKKLVRSLSAPRSDDERRKHSNQDLFSNPSAVPEALFASNKTADGTVMVQASVTQPGSPHIPKRKPIRKLVNTSTYSWIPPPSSTLSNRRVSMPSMTGQTGVILQWYRSTQRCPITDLEQAVNDKMKQRRKGKQSLHCQDATKHEKDVYHVGKLNLNRALPPTPPPSDDVEDVIDTFDRGSHYSWRACKWASRRCGGEVDKMGDRI